MNIYKLPLEEDFGENKPYLAAYIQDEMPMEPAAMPAVLVCPGGGYTHLSPREAEPIAMAFAARGFQTFVLYYSLKPKMWPQPLMDAAKAMMMIREHAKEWRVDPDKIAMGGFSAGGHLSAALSTFWNDPLLAEAGIDCEKAKPNAAILCYAVVQAGVDANNPGTFAARLLGEEPEKNPWLKAAYIPQYVGEQNPPTFLWHTATDQTVPVANCLRMTEALAAHKVPVELHVFPQGPHGLALATERTCNGYDNMIVPEAAQWVDLCSDWLKRMFK
ncbi:MAG: alpha/beta hydrolase [Firmicutes bacterium]|nr:alpha/beta hydrolase [Bacillota bacterium]